jgi:phosphoribosylaminoimidazolecarboxamide formyltransferase/IMP cyclohydrolase
MSKKIQSALISVYYKDNLEPIIKLLAANGVTIYSTGGTQSFIEELGVSCVAVEDLTGYPSILGGRVKTLHPKVFGGILNRRGNDSDVAEITEFEIPEIDLVIVDLYPCEQTVASGADDKSIIEKIDIGGISLIRAAAKNFNDVVIVSAREQYTELLNILTENNCGTTLEHRRYFAAQAFNTSSHYDTAIFNWFNKTENIPAFKQSIQGGETLRYGENPHQKGTFYGDIDKLFTKLNGKELSYNNLLDVDAAVALIDEFTEDITYAILKHNNACGIATAKDGKTAYLNALAGDPVSAFGGVIITNTTVDLATAQELNSLFFEVLIAPAFDNDALELLTTKKNRILLLRKQVEFAPKQFKTLLHGVIEQDKDLKTETLADFKVVTTKAPTEAEQKAMLFANKLVKHTKSNAIILANENQLISSGVGQTSRVDALRQAIEKANAFGFKLEGAVMASDAFFPFPDCVEIAHKVGITAVIQPGGSVKDQASVDYCNENGLSMVMTGFRHFKH